MVAQENISSSSLRKLYCLLLGFKPSLPFTCIQIFIQRAALDPNPRGSSLRADTQAHTDLQRAESFREVPGWPLYCLPFQCQLLSLLPAPSSVSFPLIDSLGALPELSVGTFCCLISSLLFWSVTFTTNTVKPVVTCIRNKASS